MPHLGSDERRLWLEWKKDFEQSGRTPTSEEAELLDWDGQGALDIKLIQMLFRWRDSHPT